MTIKNLTLNVARLVVCKEMLPSPCAHYLSFQVSLVEFETKKKINNCISHTVCMCEKTTRGVLIDHYLTFHVSLVEFKKRVFVILLVGKND
jgi:hypothetical protein